jgi:putative aldouronate transport system permease protein
MKYFQSTGDRILMAFIYFLLAISLIFFLYPLIYIISSSFSSPQAVISGLVWLYPVNPSLAGYRAVFTYKLVWSGYINSFIVTAAGTLLSLIFTVMLAYALSCKEFALKKFITVLMTITMFFSGGLIPSYLLINRLKMMNTLWALFIPGILRVWYVFMVRTYIQSSIPVSLSEAAKLDGCSHINYLIKIVIPLSKPILAVITLYVAVSYWNSYFSAMIYIRDQSKYPLQIVLRNILLLNQFDPSAYATLTEEEMRVRQHLNALMKYSLIIVSSVPVMLLYPFVQKYFIRGVMIGSIKG